MVVIEGVEIFDDGDVHELWNLFYSDMVVKQKFHDLREETVLHYTDWEAEEVEGKKNFRERRIRYSGLNSVPELLKKTLRMSEFTLSEVQQVYEIEDGFHITVVPTIEHSSIGKYCESRAVHLLRSVDGKTRIEWSCETNFTGNLFGLSRLIEKEMARQAKLVQRQCFDVGMNHYNAYIEQKKLLPNVEIDPVMRIDGAAKVSIGEHIARTPVIPELPPSILKARATEPSFPLSFVMFVVLCVTSVGLAVAPPPVTDTVLGPFVEHLNLEISRKTFFLLGVAFFCIASIVAGEASERHTADAPKLHRD